MAGRPSSWCELVGVGFPGQAPLLGACREGWLWGRFSEGIFQASPGLASLPAAQGAALARVEGTLWAPGY